MMTLKTRFKYSDDLTRTYSFDVEDDLAEEVRGKIVAINASLSAGTDDGLSTFFVSDDGGNLTVINGATLEAALVVPLVIAPKS